MKYTPDNHHRRSTRLNRYDYSQAGAYFVTICTWQKECLFGDIGNNEMTLNEYGTIVANHWDVISDYVANVERDEFVVMPNHVHGIIILNNVGAQFIAPYQFIAPVGNNRPAPQRSAINQNKNQGVINHAPTVGEIVRAFKARCTHMINQIRNTPGHPVWQRNYYEHVIRNEDDLNRIRQYIIDNPIKWADDENNPENIICRGLINGKGLINQTPTKQ
jgi:REP element-mobilizing transposase RayT